jgi:hypothetical protein
MVVILARAATTVKPDSILMVEIQDWMIEGCPARRERRNAI